MITLITGVPGSGKTAGALDLILKEYGDRPLFVDGLNGLKLEHVPIDVMDWPAQVPDGAVVVVDEVQRKWRPRGPGGKVPDSVAALETHRHRGIDFVIITQNPRLVDTNVRALVGRHVHIRSTGFLGRWAYEWPECNTELSWAKCQNKRRYKLPKKVFDLYTSASLHTKPVHKIPLTMFFLAAVVLGLLAVGFWFYRGQKKAEAPPLPVSQGSPFTGATPPPAPSKPAFIDDRVDFLPRVSDVPESAPAYDGLRHLVNMPTVSGGVCKNGQCKCYTQQGTPAGLTSEACKKWMDAPPFDHYTVKPPSTVAASGSPSVNTQSAPPENVPGPPQVVTVAPMPSGAAINARAEARHPSALPPGSPVHTTQPTDEAGIIPPPTLLNPYRKTQLNTIG